MVRVYMGKWIKSINEFLDGLYWIFVENKEWTSITCKVIAENKSMQNNCQ